MWYACACDVVVGEGKAVRKQDRALVVCVCFRDHTKRKRERTVGDEAARPVALYMLL